MSYPVWRYCIDGGWRGATVAVKPPREDGSRRIRLHLWGFDFQRWDYVPDTPHALRWMRTLAIDWCAHGVSPVTTHDESGRPIPGTTTGSGLPRRGVVSLDAAWDGVLNHSTDWTDWVRIYLRLHDERDAVREAAP